MSSRMIVTHHECKKCGCDRVYGPTYDREEDRLRFHCGRCGHVWSTPTVESRRRDFEDASRRGSKNDE